MSFEIWSMWVVITTEWAWWLLMVRHPFGAKASATKIMAYANRCMSGVPQCNDCCSWWPVAYFTKEVNLRLAKCRLIFNGRLAKRGLTSLVKEVTGINRHEGISCYNVVKDKTTSDVYLTLYMLCFVEKHLLFVSIFPHYPFLCYMICFGIVTIWEDSFPFLYSLAPGRFQINFR